MRVEWLILADAAQVNGGKLYLMGGGWDQLNVSSAFPVQQRMGLAASFMVPWNETNQKRNVELSMVTDDGEEMLKINGQVEVGRPAGIPAGSEQRAQLSADMGVEFKKPGVYSIIARIDGEEASRIAFRVMERPKA
ncbi:MAG TPA: hypothetical protein VFY10_02310 [Dehalococcoidia bacterium]|nr:hypothetical protein [Dehalococcoidia bacterium]